MLTLTFSDLGTDMSPNTCSHMYLFRIWARIRPPPTLAHTPVPDLGVDPADQLPGFKRPPDVVIGTGHQTR